MDMIFSKRATQIEEGIFSILNTKKEELLQAGREVYNFSVGTPDFENTGAYYESNGRGLQGS